jgi:hypothetical protein
MSNVVPDLIRHPSQFWIYGFAGMTALTYIVTGVIIVNKSVDVLTHFWMDTI